MSCLLGLVDTVFVVRWQNPEVSDLGLIQDGIIAAHKRLKVPILYLAIIPVDCPAPSPRVREEMTRSMEVLLEHCSNMYFVIEGSGFKHSMLRSVLSTILLVSSKRGRCSVHTTVSEALGHASRSMKLDVAGFNRQARAQSLVL